MKNNFIFQLKSKITFWGLLCLFLISQNTLFAQEANLSGKVSSSSGEPLPGVSVSVKGTKRGTVTDGNGTFKIAAKNGETLVFSFIGMKSLEKTINNDDAINVSLQEDASTLGEVAVVGSRSTSQRTNIDKAVPVDIISPKELKGFSQVDLGQILNFVAPSFNSNRQTVADGTDHVDPASLRGLGPDQVLVLVNGKRRHTSALLNINGTVGRGSVGTDMNVIPVAAIERIEVLRDGAAAQYGSDAIAGVINVVLKKDAGGLSASVTTGMNLTNMSYNMPNISGGQTKVSEDLRDGKMLQFDLSKGFKLGNSGKMSVSAQYNNREATNRSGLDNAPTIYLGASGGFPSTPSGQTNAEFRPKLIAEDAAIAKSRNYNRQNMIFGNSSSENIGLFVNGGFAKTGKSELYFSGGITHRNGRGYGNNRIPVSRAQQPLKSDGSLYYPDGFLPAIESKVNDQSLLVGYRSKMGMWNFDLSNTFGHNSFNFTVNESGNASLPNNDTQQTKFDAGTLSFDQNTTNLDLSRMFEKAGPIDGLNIAFGAEFRRDHYKIEAGETNSYIGADLKKTVPTAPLTTGGPAAGSTLALPGAQVFPGFQPGDQIDKARTNLGLYADLEGQLGKVLLIGLASRYENYSDFGSNLSGKVSARAKLTESFALRGSASTGFRAPSLHQRYFQNTSTQFVSGLPSNTLTVNNDNAIARQVIGVDALRPETSKSLTVGLTANLAKNVSVSIDAYQIKIADRIVYSGAFSRSLLGFTADQYVGINNVNFFANAANTLTKGVDIVATAKGNLGSGAITFTAALNFNENTVESINSTELINSPAKNDPTKTPDDWFKNKLFDRQQRSRIEVWQPKNKVNLSATYQIGKIDITARLVRFGEVQYIHNLEVDAKKSDGTYWNTQFARDANGKALIDQTFKPVAITDLVLGYRLSNNLNLSVGANNLFDIYPDQIYIDPRNAYGSIDYASGRDASNRGRLLYQPNQGGYNGRFVFARLSLALK